jgi:hypothetical protein
MSMTIHDNVSSLSKGFHPRHEGVMEHEKFANPAVVIIHKRANK